MGGSICGSTGKIARTGPIKLYLQAAYYKGVNFMMNFKMLDCEGDATPHVCKCFPEGVA
jgi:hypothetical protein